MRRGLKPRDVRRAMRRMGMELEEVTDVSEAILRSRDREITISEPTVTVMSLGRKDKVFQITGGKIVEKLLEGAIPEEDARLVAQQANATIEEARDALRTTGGDLAQAIILLKGRKG
ncbi:MAG: nascent polypeptide-associated complex protein [Candidatus Bathyarchaeia archaeon]